MGVCTLKVGCLPVNNTERPVCSIRCPAVVTELFFYFFFECATSDSLQAAGESEGQTFPSGPLKRTFMCDMARSGLEHSKGLFGPGGQGLGRACGVERGGGCGEGEGPSHHGAAWDGWRSRRSGPKKTCGGSEQCHIIAGPPPATLDTL